jgi:hypothetical protein
MTFASRSTTSTRRKISSSTRDAMPRRGQITIETANAYLDEAYCRQFGDVTPGQYVLLSVADTGGGIPPDGRAHRLLRRLSRPPGSRWCRTSLPKQFSSPSLDVERMCGPVRRAVHAFEQEPDEDEESKARSRQQNGRPPAEIRQGPAAFQ